VRLGLRALLRVVPGQRLGDHDAPRLRRLATGRNAIFLQAALFH
jgi:hypothetical protein